jgi:hypothetical protein
MARNSRLFNMYRKSQSGLNVGLTYEEWLEGKLQTEDGHLIVPVISVSVFRCPICNEEYKDKCTADMCCM